MFSTKIRTIIVVLAAAFAVAVATAPIVPAAHARDNYVVNERLCDELWGEFAVYVWLAVEADRAGRTAARDFYLDEAREAKVNARQLGCDWAQSRAAAVDRLGGRPAGDGLLTQQPGDSPTTGPRKVSPRDSTPVGEVAPPTGGETPVTEGTVVENGRPGLR